MADKNGKSNKKIIAASIALFAAAAAMLAWLCFQLISTHTLKAQYNSAVPPLSTPAASETAAPAESDEPEESSAPEPSADTGAGDGGSSGNDNDNSEETPAPDYGARFD
jgi:hypothetical protein